MESFIQNDPLLRHLKFAPGFQSVLQNNPLSIQRLIRQRILEMYSMPIQYKVADQSIASAPQAVFDHRMVLERSFQPLPPLPLRPIRQYKNQVVILVHNNNVITPQLNTEARNNAMQPVCIVMDECNPRDSRQFAEQILAAQTQPIAGFIFIPQSIPQGTPQERYQLILNQMQHLLGWSQALYPSFSTPPSQALPFFGIITQEAITRKAAPDPFMAALHSQINVLPLTYKKHAIIKGLDFPAQETVSAAIVFTELTTNDRTGSIHYHNDKRYTIEWCPVDNDWLKNPLPPEKKDTSQVILAVGGGTGITAQSIEEIALHNPCRYILTGRTQLQIDKPFHSVLHSTAQGTELQDLIIKTAKEHAISLKPEALMNLVEAIHKIRSIESVLAKLNTLGAQAEYRPCNFNNSPAVDTLVQEIQNDYGRIDTVIYGAGLDRSMHLTSKDMESFDQVLQPKILGTMNLAHAVRNIQTLNKIVFFSSYYTWQGMLGSMDYTAGNRFMGECRRLFEKSSGTPDIITLYWGPWDSPGMAGTDYLKEYFDSYGIGMIPPDHGRKIFAHALHTNTSETAVAPIKSEHNFAEMTGYLQGHDEIIANQQLALEADSFPFLDRVIAYCPNHSLKAIKSFSLDNDLYIHDHIFDKVPIVPGVICTEIMTEAARFLVPGTRILEAADVQFTKPFQIRTSDKVHALVQAEIIDHYNERTTVQVSLSEIEVTDDGRVKQIISQKDSAIMTLGSYDLPAQTMSPSAPHTVMEGLQVAMPIDACLAMCRMGDYDFGPLLTGTTKTVFANMKTCRMTSEVLKPILRYRDDNAIFSTAPLAIDMSLQCQLKNLFWRQGTRIIPTKAPIIRFGVNPEKTRTFTCRVSLEACNPRNRNAVIRGEIYNPAGELIVEAEVDTFMRNTVDLGDALFNSLTDQGQAGYIYADTLNAITAACVIPAGKEQTILSHIPSDWTGSNPLSKEALINFTASRSALQAVIQKLIKTHNVPYGTITFDPQRNLLRWKINTTHYQSNVSFSHCNGWGMAGINLSHQVIGVDIESCTKKELEPKVFLSDKEIEIITDFANSQLIPLVTLIPAAFSIKEAVFKAYPQIKDMREIEILGTKDWGCIQCRHNSIVHTISCDFHIFDNKVISVCAPFIHEEY